MLEVDGLGRAVILATGVDRGRVGEATQVFGHGFGSEYFEAAIAPAHLVFDEKFRVGTDQRFREGRGLDQKEPVKIGFGESAVGVA